MYFYRGKVKVMITEKIVKIYACKMNYTLQTRGLVSKETVVLRPRWERKTQKFWIYQLS